MAGVRPSFLSFKLYVEGYLQGLVTTNVFLGLQTFHLELPENRQRWPATLTVKHRYIYTVNEAL